MTGNDDVQSRDRSLADDHRPPTMVDIDGTPRSAPITVVIADPLLLVAEGLGGTLGCHEDMEVAAVAGSCAEALSAVGRHRPDVVLLEQYLPDGLGTDCVPAMVEACPQVNVLMVTADDGDDLLIRAITGGAAGVVLKTNGMETLVKTIRAAARGEAVVSAGDLRRVLPRAAQASLGLGHDLTTREREVLKLLSEGRSTSAMAGTLFVAAATARNHVQSIMTKLGAHSRLEAVAIALRENIIRAA
jgi:DNA-binding NarL/FixJ family response regulator